MFRPRRLRRKWATALIGLPLPQITSPYDAVGPHLAPQLATHRPACAGAGLSIGGRRACTGESSGLDKARLTHELLVTGLTWLQV